MMIPLPIVAQAYAILTQKERQREMTNFVQFINENASFHVNTKNSHQRSYEDTKRRNKAMECRTYKKLGHTKEKC